MKSNFLFLYLLLCLTLFSCKKENKFDCLKGTGKINKEARSIKSFSTLYLTDYIHVNIIPSTFNEVIIEAGENLIPLIKTEIVGDSLIIRNDNKCDFVRSYKPQITIDLYCTNLENISLLYATGNIDTKDTLKSSYFNFFSDNSSSNIRLVVLADSARFSVQGGTADLEIEGKINIRTSLAHTGFGGFNANKLTTPVNLVYCKSLGNMHVYSNGYLWAEIQSSGNIYYSGNPVLIQKFIKKTGQLIEE